MNRVWPSHGFVAHSGKAIVLLSLAAGSLLAWCSIPTDSIPAAPQIPLAQREKSLHRGPAHISEFSPVSSPLDLPKCGDVRPPEALLTPDPLLDVQNEVQNDEMHVRVSFIVGIDGHVHSAFVLDSGGANEDQIVLHAVRFWRYRPALCNGVPTDFEALVRFSIR